jgi:hypothetical protein
MAAAADAQGAGRRRALVVRTVLISAVLLGTLAAARAAPATAVDCGLRSVGPGALVRSVGPGPSCLLRAFEQRCRPASYRLSSFGVDTIGTDTFRTVRRAGACEVAVTIMFHLVPQPPKRTGSGYCRTLRRRGIDVVAGGCTGTGLPASLSLSGR